MAKDSSNNVRHDVAALAAKFGLVPTTSRDENERAQAHMHYVGFDNATLLKTNENHDKKMYTNGIVGCNAFVLSGEEGTYMAHIDVSILNRTSTNDMSRLTNATINAYGEQIGAPPEIAYIITDGTPHAGIINALRQNNIYYAIQRDNQYSIGVGASGGSTDIRRNSNLNFPNRDCTRNNLLPAELQWGAMSRELEREVRPVVHSQHYTANSIRQNLQEYNDTRPQLYDDGTGTVGPHYMKHTASSLAKRKDTSDLSEQVNEIRQNLQDPNIIARPQLYDDGTGTMGPHYTRHTESSLAKRVDKSSHNRS